MKVGTLNKTSLLASLLAALLVMGAGCTSNVMTDGPDPEPDEEIVEPEPAAPEVSPSTKNDLLWRRYRAFEQGLGTALNLAPGELCTELGRYDCIDQVHLVALGGNDPINAGMHEPMKSPTATTPVAVERLTLSACDAAVTADAARPVPLIFLDLDLSATAAPLDLDDEITSLAVGDTITSLYRRLHARDPQPEERATVLKIITEDPEPLQPRAFALLSCFAIASTAESVFQ
jgi:hypothetical protein